MSNQNLFRYAGWSALLSVLFSLGLFGVLMATNGDRGMLFNGIFIIASLFSVIVFYGLYVFHRPQAAMPSLLMLIVGVVGLVLEGFGSGPGSPLTLLSQALGGVAYLLLGYLGFSNSQMPRGLAISAYAVGALGVLAAVTGIVSSLATVYQAVMGLFLLAWIVWSVWAWRWFVSPKLATA